MPDPALSPGHASLLAFPPADRLPSTVSATDPRIGFVRGFTGVGSEEARSIALALASVRRSNWTCSFPASSFHEDVFI
jgi:hypothetical protein